MRLLLAARALQTYDDLSLTDALLDSEAPDLEAKLERLLLSTAHGPPDATDRRLITELMVRDETPKSRALNAWLRSSWLFDGASEALLKEVFGNSRRWL